MVPVEERNPIAVGLEHVPPAIFSRTVLATPFWSHAICEAVPVAVTSPATPLKVVEDLPFHVAAEVIRASASVPIHVGVNEHDPEEHAI